MTQSNVLGAVPSGSGLAVRQSLNSCIQALATQNEGSSSPSPTYSFMQWRNNTTKIVYTRNATNTGWEISINYGSTSAPSVTNDISLGYVQGSLWYDTLGDAVYVCVDSAVSAASWKNIGVGTGGGGGTPDDNSVTNAKLANVSSQTIKGRNTAGVGDPEDLSATDVRTIINVANGATAFGATGDAFAASHAGSTGTAHGVATASVAGFMPAADKVKLDAATSAATASALAIRDAGGRLAIATPVAVGDAATKAYVDGLAFTGGVPKLDDCLSPDDNTDLNVTASAHGLMPKRDGDSTHFFCGDGTWKVPPGTPSSANPGTTVVAYASDPVLSSTDDIVEVYLGSRVTLPAFSANKQDRIRVINAGNATCTVRANSTASIVNGFKVVDVTASAATRFVSSVAAPNPVGSQLAISFWIREDAHTNNRGIIHFANGVEESTGSYFRVSATYATTPFIQLESKNANVVTLLRRYAITQQIVHHVLISIDLSAPTVTVAIDGIVVGHDTSLAGNTLTAAQPIGGSSQPIRIGTKITGLAEEFAGSLGQIVVWQDVWPTITESSIRRFYSDGPCAISSTTVVDTSTPIICLNTAPTGTPAAVSNTGSRGGTFTDSFGSGVSGLDIGNLDAPMLEQIDGFPDGYILPVGISTLFVRKTTEGVWMVV